MPDSTSSISSNEGRNNGTGKLVTPIERGYHLSTPSSTPATTPGSRPSTPPPNLLNSTAPTSTNSPSSSSRNALGISRGWGIGLAHSGSYLATNVRTSSTIPLLVEESDTYDAIRNILIQKNLRREKSQTELSKKKHPANRESLQKEGDDAREAAVRTLNEARARLQKLVEERDDSEKNIREEWDRKITKFKEESLRKEEQVLDALRTKYKLEIDQMIEDSKARTIADREELATTLTHMDEETKRRCQGSGKHTTMSDSTENRGCSTVVPKSTKNEIDEDGASSTNEERPGNIKIVLLNSPMKDVRNDAQADDSDEDLFDDSDDDAENPLSVKKKDLKKITEELNELNEIKSQMVWLLKQVITAEAKLKLKRKAEKLNS